MESTSCFFHGSFGGRTSDQERHNSQCGDTISFYFRHKTHCKYTTKNQCLFLELAVQNPTLFEVKDTETKAAGVRSFVRSVGPRVK